MRRPLRRRRFLPRIYEMRGLRDFYLNLLKDIESMVKGNEFTAVDYLEFYNDRDVEVSSEDIEKYLTDAIGKKFITNLKYEEKDGVKTFTKTDLPYQLVYEKLDRYLNRERERSYTFSEIFSEDYYSINMKKQLKEAFENVIKDSPLVEKKKDKDGKDVYIFKAQPRENPDPTVLFAVFKVSDLKVDTEFTLSELLAEAPTAGQVKTFNSLIESGVFANSYNDIDVKCKGLNNSGEMVYKKEKNEY